MSKLYALIVGVNEYQDSPLSGCVRDAESVKSYLESSIVKSQFEELAVITLLNEQGTKQRVIEGFRQHLNQAEKGDTVLFYFSGHGGREKTDFPIFQSGEIDSNLGSLICSGFSSKAKDLSPFLLSNKEIRYLIGPLANQNEAHVVTIFDCCHSGSNTRSIERDQQPSKSRQILRAALPGRPLDQFLFAEDTTLLEKLKKNEKPLDSLIPQGEHVMLAACREVELAWETSRGPSRGVFTDALLHVLNQHQGRISYQELHSRVLNRMTFSISESQGDKGQTPQLFVKTKDPADRYSNVLTNEPNSTPSYGVVEFYEKDAEWRLALGAFHGLEPDKPNQKAQVYPVGKKERASAIKIKEVFPFYCTLETNSETKISPQEVYRGEIITLGLQPTSFFIDPSGKQMEAVKSFLVNQLDSTAAGKWKLAATEDVSDYVLTETNEKLLLCPAFEPTRPLIKRLGFLTEEGIPDQEILLQFSQTLTAIGQWSLIRNLEYAVLPVPDYLTGETEMFPVEFKLYQWDPDSATEKRIYANDRKFILQLDDMTQPLWIRYEIVNHADQELNVSLAIMTQDFSFLVKDQKNGLKGPVIPLTGAEDADDGHITYSIPSPSGQGISPADKPSRHYVPIAIDPYYVDFNVPGESIFFKLIASSKPLDPISSFHTDPMGYPKKEATSSRSFMMKANDEDVSAYPPVEWDLKTIEIYVTNPEFKQ